MPLQRVFKNFKYLQLKIAEKNKTEIFDIAWQTEGHNIDT